MWQIKNIRLEQPDDMLDSENFLDRVFGLARHQRTVNLMRKNIPPNYDHSFYYQNDDQELLGMIRNYDIQLDDGTVAVLLGPIAIHPDHQQKGLGKFLIYHSLSQLDKEKPKNHLIFLIGNVHYYKQFGFYETAESGERYDDRYYLDGPVAPLILTIRCHDKKEPLKHNGRINFLNLL